MVAFSLGDWVKDLKIPIWRHPSPFSIPPFCCRSSLFEGKAGPNSSHFPGGPSLPVSLLVQKNARWFRRLQRQRFRWWRTVFQKVVACSSCFAHRPRNVFRRLRRHLRQSHAALSPLEKRTALSLRPIGLKSYADSPTPHTYNTEEDTEPEKELGEWFL